MKNRKHKGAPPEAPSPETVTPFFARYLEGQAPEPDAEANVSAGRGQAEFTYKSAKATKKSSTKKSSKSGKSSATSKSAKSAKSSKSKSARPPAVTLKYPSDTDELVFYPYKPEAIAATGGLRATRKYPSDLDEAVTLKYPSDDDEVGYFPVYTSRAEVPKGASAKPKEGRVQLSRKPPK